MDKALVFAGIYKLPLLMDELLAVFPEWLMKEDDEWHCLLRVEGNDKGVRLTVPDGADESAIAAVVAAHDPDALSVAEQVAAAQANIEAKATEARSLWDGYEALRDKTPADIEALVRARIGGWPTLAAAKADLAEWLPRMAGLLAWAVRKS